MTASAAPMTDGGLTTLNPDGSRRWLTPRLSHGRFLRRRRAVAWFLIALFTLLPYLRINDKPAVLLDVAHRKFTLFGFTFLPTDTVLLAPLLIGVFILIFLLTALFGRVWCGWACPQTVYMEFLYRPIERLSARWFKGSGFAPVFKYGLYLLASAALAHTFLAYFVGVEALVQWVQRSPFEHPASFLLMAGVTGLMMFDFAYFREQMCIVACPYGRFQSVLLDRRSLIISYDQARGEPRGKARRAPKKEPCANCGKPGGCGGRGHDHAEEGGVAVALRVLAAPAPPEPRPGDCVDCFMCVHTCPTGIDIRNGLQMECIGCAQCIDACDAVMAKLGRAPGLIRYSTQAGMNREAGRRLRPRLFVYPALLAAASGAFVWAMAVKSPADVSLLRGPGAPFSEMAGGMVSNPVKLKIVNRTERAAAYTVTVGDGRIELAENPLTVGPGQSRSEPGLIVAPREAFAGGHATVQVTVTDGAGFTEAIRYRLVGPAGQGGQHGTR